jgi:hypothetical protein
MAAAAEPRAPRHAIAISQAIQDAEVLFIDCAPAGQTLPEPKELLENARVRRKTIFTPHRGSRILHRLFSEAGATIAKLAFRLTGVVPLRALGARTPGMAQTLCAEGADVFIAHNLETLMPAARAARKFRAKLMFDCMEFYSDMGDIQTDFEKKLARAVESEWLTQCNLEADRK